MASQILYPSRNPPPGVSTHTSWIKTAAEKIEAADIEPSQTRLLLSMLLHGPSVQGRLSIAWAVHELPGGSEHVAALADYLFDNVIKPVRATGGKTPKDSTRSESPFGFNGGDAPGDVMRARHRQGQLKKQCFSRDGWTCVVSGAVDAMSPAAIKDNAYRLDLLEAAHILPFSLNRFNDKDRDVVDQRQVFWSALTAFCGSDLGFLEGEGINSVENALVLTPAFHDQQGRLKLAFEAVEDEANTYNIVAYGEPATSLLSHLPRHPTSNSPRVTFVDHSRDFDQNTTPQPLPDPILLKLHASLCKALHASGRAEELDLLMDWLDEDAPAILAEDGGSASLLEMAIARLVAVY